jgi:hypothetical protein
MINMSFPSGNERNDESARAIRNKPGPPKLIPTRYKKLPIALIYSKELTPFYWVKLTSPQQLATTVPKILEPLFSGANFPAQLLKVS